VLVQAQLKALETRRSPEERHAWKLRLVKGLYERGMDPEGVRRLFDFIDWVMELPEPLEHIFWDDIEAYRREKVMPFINIATRVEIERALLEGIEPLLDVKFGVEGLALMPEIREIRDHVLLRKILKRIRTASSPAEVRRVWTRKPRPKPTEPMTEDETPPEEATPAPRRSGRRRS
jgi:hypothetical protein